MFYVTKSTSVQAVGVGFSLPQSFVKNASRITFLSPKAAKITTALVALALAQSSISSPANAAQDGLTATAFFAKGFDALKNNDAPRAIEFFKAGLKKQPGNYQAKFYLGEAYILNGAPASAGQLFRQLSADAKAGEFATQARSALETLVPVKGQPKVADGCTIGEVAPPNATVGGVWINVGAIYHVGSLSIRINSYDGTKGYSLDIKSPDYSDSWTVVPDGGPANFKACGKDVSLAIVRYLGLSIYPALIVGRFETE